MIGEVGRVKLPGRGGSSFILHNSSIDSAMSSILDEIIQVGANIHDTMHTAQLRIAQLEKQRKSPQQQTQIAAEQKKLGRPLIEGSSVQLDTPTHRLPGAHQGPHQR